MRFQQLTSYAKKFRAQLEVFLEHQPGAWETCKYFALFLKDFAAYRLSIRDYFELGFFKIRDAAEKKTYMTQIPYKKMTRELDSEEKIWEHNSKSYQYRHLKQYMGRDQLFSAACSEAEFAAFVKAHPVFVLKPDEKECGTGVQKINSADYALKDLYEYVTSEPAIVDELIEQHPEMSRICPGSVNTLRIITAKVGNEITILGAALRMGSGESFVDNYSAGGIVCAVDIATGEVPGYGEDHAGRRYEAHPFSHVRFRGFRIPNWDKVLDLVRSCAEAYDMHIVGWDVAVRQTDAIIVKANVAPMIHAIQIAGNGGKRAAFEEVLRKWRACPEEHGKGFIGGGTQ